LKLDNPFILIDIIPLFYIRLLKYVTSCLICLNSSIAAFERTASYKIFGQVDFSSQLEMTCNETDNARKFRRWRCYRPTWHDLEGSSRLESTWSTRLPGLPVGEFLKKKFKKNFCVYFTYLPKSPPCADLHEILHEGSSSQRNQPCQILYQSDPGFWFCGGGSNFWLSHRKEKSPL